MWVRYQPQSASTQWRQRRFADSGPRSRKIGIVAVVRCLLIALWRYLEQGSFPAAQRSCASAGLRHAHHGSGDTQFSLADEVLVRIGTELGRTIRHHSSGVSMNRRQGAVAGVRRTAPGAAGRTFWCGDRRMVVGTSRRRVSRHRPRPHGSPQLGCSPCRDERQLAPFHERAGVLNRVKVPLASLTADATLTRFPRARQRASIGASRKSDRVERRRCDR